MFSTSTSKNNTIIHASSSSNLSAMDGPGPNILSLLHPDTIPPIGTRGCGQPEQDLSDLLCTIGYVSPPPSSSSSSSSSPTNLLASTNAVDSSSSESGVDLTCSDESDQQSDQQSSDQPQHTPSQLHYYRNREKILAYAKLRYKNNRDRLLAYSKQYQHERKDVVKDRNVTYYERNRDRLLKDRAIKITCECGKKLTKGSLSGHLQTKYHTSRVGCHVGNHVDSQDGSNTVEVVTPEQV